MDPRVITAYVIHEPGPARDAAIERAELLAQTDDTDIILDPDHIEEDDNYLNDPFWLEFLEESDRQYDQATGK